jgi:hypothetical protein
MKWGVVDTETGLWLGDYAGAFLYASPALASDAVGVANLRLGWRGGRLIVREAPDEPTPDRLRELFKTVGVEVRE